MSIKERKTLSADPPHQWKSDFKPRDYVDYIEHVEQTALQSTGGHVQDAIQAPSAFKDCAYNKTPDAEDHALANDYKVVADPADPDKKAIDDMNKRLFRIVYAAAKDFPLAKGTMDSAPFVRYPTFKAFIRSKYGGATKTAESMIVLAKAKIRPNPNHPDLLLDIDQTKNCHGQVQRVQAYQL